MKFNKGKQPILNPGQVDSGCMDRQGNKRLENRAAERDLGLLADGKLNMSQQCPGSQEGQLCPWGASGSILGSWATEGIVLLCSALGLLHLKSWGQFGTPQYKKDPKLLGSVQRSLQRWGPYKEWLRSLGLYSLGKRRQRRDSVEVHNFLTRAAEGQLCSL